MFFSLSFSDQELLDHAAEEESMSNAGEILKLFQGSGGLPPNGMVDAAEFDRIQTTVTELRRRAYKSPR